MKQLALLRHAKSSWDDRRIPDHDRPLAPRGLRDAPRMGERVARRGLEPDLLLASSARRAGQTAELVAPALGDPPISTDGTIYLASPGTLLELIRGQSDDIGTLVLVGHNPGFTQLANMLLPDLALSNLPTAGVVAINVDASLWREFDAAALSLWFYEYPKARPG